MSDVELLQKTASMNEQVSTMLAKIDEITDRKLAMLWLCRTPEAWAKISDELKRDSEVMMCYQPTGYILLDKYRLSVVKGNFVREYVGQSGYIEPEFEPEPSGLLVPTAIKDDENFDLNLYCEIQKEMYDSALNFQNCGKMLDEQGFQHRMTKASFENVSDGNQTELTLILFNRTSLKQLMGIEDPEFDAMTR